MDKDLRKKIKTDLILTIKDFSIKKICKELNITDSNVYSGLTSEENIDKILDRIELELSEALYNIILERLKLKGQGKYSLFDKQNEEYIENVIKTDSLQY